MALSLKTISVGSETGVQDIQSNFTTIKSAVDALQNSVSEIKIFRDFTCMNGTNNGTAGNTADLILLNYQTYQILCVNIWLNNINFTEAWQNKQVISVPKSYFKFSKSSLISTGAPEFFDSNAVVDISLNPITGIITATNRTKTVNDSRLIAQLLIYG